MDAGEDFWSVVGQAFKARELTRADLTALVDRGLTETRGSWQVPFSAAVRPRDRELNVVALDFGAKKNILRCLVDAGCRVHSPSNVYVAGSSVFPTTGNDMPTLTIVALALRLAEHVATLF